MNRVHPFKMSALVCLILFFAAFSAVAGQLVTTDHQKWAGQVVQQEKELAALTKPNSIAVLYFRNTSDDRTLDPLQKGLTVMLISDLAKLDMVTVVERAEIQALVEELGFGQSGLVDPTSAPRVGRLLQSQYLIGGSLAGNAATEVTAGARLIDVAPGKLIGSATAKKKMEQIFDLEKKLLNQIVTDLQLNLTQKQKEDLGKPLSRDQNALMDLFRGIDAADHQQYEEAAQFLDRAIQRDPQLTLAKTSLQEISKRISAKNSRRILRSIRSNVSFTTELEPATPVARIPFPASVQPTRPEQRDPTFDDTSDNSDQ